MEYPNKGFHRLLAVSFTTASMKLQGRSKTTIDLKLKKVILIK